MELVNVRWKIINESTPPQVHSFITSTALQYFIKMVPFDWRGPLTISNKQQCNTLQCFQSEQIIMSELIREAWCVVFTKPCWTWNGFTKGAFYYWKKWDQLKNKELQFHCSSCTGAVHCCYRNHVLWSVIATLMHFLSLLPSQSEASATGTEHPAQDLQFPAVVLFTHHVTDLLICMDL